MSRRPSTFRRRLLAAEMTDARTANVNGAPALAPVCVGRRGARSALHSDNDDAILLVLRAPLFEEPQQTRRRTDDAYEGDDVSNGRRHFIRFAPVKAACVVARGETRRPTGRRLKCSSRPSPSPRNSRNNAAYALVRIFTRTSRSCRTASRFGTWLARQVSPSTHRRGAGRRDVRESGSRWRHAVLSSGASSLVLPVGLMRKSHRPSPLESPYCTHHAL